MYKRDFNSSSSIIQFGYCKRTVFYRTPQVVLNTSTMKSLLCLAALVVLMSVALAGHSGIHVKIPLPFIKIRFVDIAHLFGHHGHHGGGGFEIGGHGHGGHHSGFGINIGGGHGGHHGW